MICSVITIILSIISFTNAWFFIPTAIFMVLAVAEYIIETIAGKIINNIPLTIGAIVLGIVALVLTIISVCQGVGKISSENERSLLISLMMLLN